MMTPLQRYRNGLAERGIELAPAQAYKVRAMYFAMRRRYFMKAGVPCPNDDDALQEWMVKHWKLGKRTDACNQETT